MPNDEPSGIPSDGVLRATSAEDAPPPPPPQSQGAIDDLRETPQFRDVSHLRRNWFSYVTLLLLILTFVNVKQISTLFELPQVGTGVESRLWVLMGLYCAMLTAIYLAAGAWVVPFHRHQLSAIPRWQLPLYRFVNRHWKILTGLFLSLAAVVGSIALFVPGDFLPRCAADRLLLWTGTCFLLAAALTSAFWPRMAFATQRLLTRSIGILLVLNIGGELVWNFGQSRMLLSPRNYSLWAILHIFFCAFLFARVIDVWQSYSRWPVRGVAIIVLILFAGTAGPSQIVQPATDETGKSAPAGDRDEWLDHLLNRLNQMPPDRPVILVAASGGGSRASLFTSLVLEELSRHEIPYDSLRPSGSDFDVEPPPYRPADQILLISSVSGGSLASACYLSTPYRTHEATVTESWRSRWLPKLPEGHVLPLRNSVRTELLGLTLSSLERMRCRDARHYQREVATVEDDIVVKDFLIEAQTQLKEEGEASWIFECPLADHMCTDFMAPLLRGTLHPGLDRGEHVRAFWESELCLDTTNVDWNTVHSANSPAPPPVLLCNATDVKTGRRMIIGFPPLPEDFFTPHKLLAHEQTRLNQVRSWRDATRTCKTAGSVRKITLADAVRISANFPWGFPIARVSGTDLRLIDGGVCDNTGLDSISYVLEALSHWSKLDRIENGKLSKQDESRSRKAKTIIDRLKERGVILLEIDSGAKPQEPSFIAQQLSGLLEPVRAMQNANFANALASVETHSNAIESSLPSEESRMLTEKLSHLVARFNEETKLQSNQRVLRLSAGELRNVRRLTITCNHQDNVITTWALGPSDKGEVLARFLAGSTKLRYDLKESLHACRIERIVLDTLSNQVDELAKSFSNLKPEQLKNDLTQAVDRRNRFVEMSVQVEDLEMARTAEQKAAFEGVALQVSGSDSTADSQMDQIQEPLHTVLKTRAITLQKERMSLFNSALDAVPAVDKKTKVIQLKKGEPSPKITPETPGENR